MPRGVLPPRSMRQRAIMLRARQRISICAGSPNDWGHLWNKRSITQQPRPAIEHTCTMARATSSGFEPVFPAITLEQRPALKPRRGRRVTEGALAPSHGPAEASRRMRVPHSGSRVPELDATHRRPAVRLCETATRSLVKQRWQMQNAPPATGCRRGEILSFPKLVWIAALSERALPCQLPHRIPYRVARRTRRRRRRPASDRKSRSNPRRTASDPLLVGE
jgi:hypothetical protein